MTEHINYICQKYKKAAWSINHIKRAGMNNSIIVTVYTSILRPIIEFCSPVYHSLITEEQSNMLERLQKMTLKIIFGFNIEYEKLLELAGITSLKERRENAFIKFTTTIASNKRYSSWFPMNEDRGLNLRRENTYKETFARTERFYNSPLFNMRRTLNRIEEENNTRR